MYEQFLVGTSFNLLIKKYFAFLMTLWNGQHQGQVQAVSIISSSYCNTTNMLQA